MKDPVYYHFMKFCHIILWKCMAKMEIGLFSLSGVKLAEQWDYVTKLANTGETCYKFIEERSQKGNRLFL